MNDGIQAVTCMMIVLSFEGVRAHGRAREMRNPISGLGQQLQCIFHGGPPYMALQGPMAQGLWGLGLRVWKVLSAQFGISVKGWVPISVQGTYT